jgi:hypothetical protein
MFEVTCGLGASPGASSTRPSGSCPRWWLTPDSTGTAGTRSPTRSAPAPRRPTCGSTRRNACHERLQNRRWGGRGSNPRPADYEKHAQPQHAPGQQRCLAGPTLGAQMTQGFLGRRSTPRSTTREFAAASAVTPCQPLPSPGDFADAPPYTLITRNQLIRWTKVANAHDGQPSPSRSSAPTPKLRIPWATAKHSL